MATVVSRVANLIRDLETLGVHRGQVKEFYFDEEKSAYLVRIAIPHDSEDPDRNIKETITVERSMKDEFHNVIFDLKIKIGEEKFRYSPITSNVTSSPNKFDNRDESILIAVFP